jgi:uncharacterized lipoprotein YmbA
MRKLKPWYALLLLAILGACGTTPGSNYYLLTADTGQVPSGTTPSLGIGPVAIPEYLNRNSLVTDTRGNEVRIASFERWAEPLGDGVQRVLALNLSSQLNTQNLRFFPWQADLAPDYGVRLTIVSMDIQDGEARLVAEWAVLVDAGRTELVRRISQQAVSVTAGELSGAAIARAYSQLLSRLSEEIAGVIRTDLAAGT